MSNKIKIAVIISLIIAGVVIMILNGEPYNQWLRNSMGIIIPVGTIGGIATLAFFKATTIAERVDMKRYFKLHWEMANANKRLFALVILADIAMIVAVVLVWQKF